MFSVKLQHESAIQFSSVQSLSPVQLIETPWDAACQASLSITNSRILLKLMSIELVIPSNHFICHPLLLLPSIVPRIRVFSVTQFFATGGQSIGLSTSAWVLPMSIQDWFPLGLAGWISLQSKGLSRVFSNTTVQKHQFFGTQLLYRRRQWHPTPVRFPGKSHGWRSLVGCSPWGLKELDTTERLHFHFSLSLIGEGNGTHFSVLAWRISGMGEPGGLPSTGSHRVGHDWSNLRVEAAASL